jgi:uncharacterized protein YpmB
MVSYLLLRNNFEVVVSMAKTAEQRFKDVQLKANASHSVSVTLAKSKKALPYELEKLDEEGRQLSDGANSTMPFSRISS